MDAIAPRWLANSIRLFLMCAMLALGAHGQATERIVIDGSTGLMPLAAALAKAFQEQNPGVVVELGKGLGTKARIQALTEAKIDIALASHGLNTIEIARQGMVAHEIARIAVVFGVNGTCRSRISANSNYAMFSPARRRIGKPWAEEISKLPRAPDRTPRWTPKWSGTTSSAYQISGCRRR